MAGCILDYLSSQQHDHASIILDRIPRAVATSSSNEIHEFLSEYDAVLHPFRDKLILSYRNLIQAKEYIIANNTVGVRTKIAWALIDLGDCEFSRQTNIQFVIDNFLRLLPVLPDQQS